MSDMSQGPGWWQASDGKWYPPEQAPGGQAGPGAPAGFGTPAAYGAPMGGGQLAEWPQRVVATLIDGVIVIAFLIVVFILAAILGAVSDVLGILVALVGYVAAFAIAIYFYWLTGATGQSPGKRLTGIKVIAESTGQPIGGGGGIIRYFAHIPDGFCMIGYLWPLWDDKKQTFADKIQSTVVVTGAPKQSFGPELFKQ